MLGGRSRTMSFDLTDFESHEKPYRNDNDYFQDMNYNCEIQTVIQEVDENQEESIISIGIRSAESSFNAVDYWKIPVVHKDLEEI